MTDRNVSFAYQIGRKSNETQPFAKTANHLMTREAFNEARRHGPALSNAERQVRDQTMVERQLPKPVLKPSAALSGDTDRAHFSQERQRDHEDAALRAFKASRRSPKLSTSQKLAIAFNHKQGASHER